MRKLLALDHPSLEPLWIRIAIVVAIFAWCGFEWYLGNTYWLVFFVALGAYCAWVFFVDYRPREPKDK